MRISDWSSDVCSSDLLALDPNSLEALWFVGHAEAAEGNLEKAKDHLDRALAQLPPAEREALRPRALEALGKAKADRSEERRGGNKWGSKCRSRWCPVF